MTTVLTARQLQDAYMSRTGAALTIDRQEFAESYGRYAIFASTKAFYDMVNSQYGGDLSRVPISGSFEKGVQVDHLITDVGSADYLSRTLGYGDQNYESTLMM